MKTVVLEAGGLVRGSTAPALEAFLRRHPAIHHAEASYFSETVTVGYDAARISEAEVRELIEQCGFHCAGRVMPRHACAPTSGMASIHRPPALAHDHARDAVTGEVAAARATSVETAAMAHEMGHGAGMDMESMVRDMRRRFWVTFVLAVAVTLFSPLVTDVFGFRVPVPFGMPHGVLLFLLSTPAVLWGGQIFFVGAWRALRRRTLDMSVLAALSVGAGYLFSVGATFLFESEVFYEASVVLLAFVLFGHWMEMRARAGASDAMRARRTPRRPPSGWRTGRRSGSSPLRSSSVWRRSPAGTGSRARRSSSRSRWPSPWSSSRVPTLSAAPPPQP